MLIFPSKEELDESLVELYQAETVETLLYDDVYFLLCCGYSQQEYEQELLRFKELGAQHQERLFQYPAYVMLFTWEYYEYALLDTDNHSIIYVFALTPNLGSADSLCAFEDFPEEYMPIARPEANIIVYQYDD